MGIGIEEGPRRFASKWRFDFRWIAFGIGFIESRAIRRKQRPCRKIAWIVEWMETGKTSVGST